MNNKALTLSLVMAVIAIFFVQSYVSSIEEQTKKKFGTHVLVLTAKDDIREMGTINSTHLRVKKIPKRFLEPNAINFPATDGKDAKKERARDIKKLSGMIAVVPIKKGEQISFNKIIEPGIRSGLSAQVTPGKRAFSVPVNDITGVSKLVKPGDRVDLIGVIDLGGGKRNRFSRTLIQDVVVLSVGKYVTNNVPRLVEYDRFQKKEKIRNLAKFDGFSSVSIEVTPSEAQQLALALAEGNKMFLSLRNNDDTDRVTLGTTNMQEVLGGAAGGYRNVSGRRRR